ncbi:hypothetical protein KSX_89760 [Ktedonospora formicarum]|uniref:Uncharacterized protein n=1 Tax=Ktedonospora formicarum TaxID=2778364 RepID=A0A8J3IBD4_9CHLR|nr:hypothetical protein KSX_89760 [Ktedonospora formicarum]
MEHESQKNMGRNEVVNGPESRMSICFENLPVEPVAIRAKKSRSIISNHSTFIQNWSLIRAT